MRKPARRLRQRIGHGAPNSRLAAEAELLRMAAPVQHRFQRAKTIVNPVAVPFADPWLENRHQTGQELTHPMNVQRMHFAGDNLGESARLGAQNRIGPQQRRLGPPLLDIFEDR